MFTSFGKIASTSLHLANKVLTRPGVLQHLFKDIPKASSSCLFNEINKASQRHQSVSGQCGGFQNGAQNKLQKKLFSTINDPGMKDAKAEKSFVLDQVNQKSVDTRFDGKPPIENREVLKNGREVVVTRLGPKDLSELYDFIQRTHFGIGDYFATVETTSSRIRELLGKAASKECDALIAKIDGKIVGLAEYDENPLEMESSVSSSLLNQAGLGKADVCVARMIVNNDFQGLGVASALKKTQIQSASDAGYLGVVSETNNPKIKSLVAKNGGFIEHEGAYTTWTFIPTTK